MFLFLFLSACGEGSTELEVDEPQHVDTTNETASIQNEIIDPVLVKVADTVIRQSQKDHFMSRLTKELRSKGKQELDKIILQSLVRARVLAIAAQKQMSAEEINQLNARVQSYKDELLVENYLKNNVTPEPVTSDMVSNYYQQHQADYLISGKVLFETISSSSTSLTDAMNDQLIAALTEAKTKPDWNRFTQALKEQGLPVVYKTAQMQDKQMNKDIRDQVKQLKPGEVGDIVFSDRIFIVKVLEKKADKIRPLHEVSVGIRNKLAPQQLKKTLTTSIDSLMNTIIIEYVN